MKLINGHTMESVRAALYKYNNGKRSAIPAPEIDNRVDSGVECLYESPGGNRCFVGCFIPDEHSGLKFLGDEYDLLSAHPDLIPLMPLSHARSSSGISDLHRFQNQHDMDCEPDSDLRESKDLNGLRVS